MIWRGVAAIAVLALAGSARAQDVQFASDFSEPGGPFARHAAAAEPFELPPLPNGSSPDEVFDNPNWTAPIDRDVVESDLTATGLIARPNCWYLRLDAYAWSEKLAHYEVISESGPLITLGYARRLGQSRYRFEIFGGGADFNLKIPTGGGTFRYHESNAVSYIGGRLEYDYLIEPPSWTRARLVLGGGTRLWNHSVDTGLLPGQDVSDFWWTFYPYVGIETREPTEPGLHFFGSARFGITPLTYERTSDVTLYPQCGITYQAELGVRGERLALSCFLESMTWNNSGTSKGVFQPDAAYATLGLRLALNY